MALGMRAQELQLGPPDPVAVAATAGALREGIVTLLVELRNLIQGIMPAPVRRGVVSAIRAMAAQVPVPPDVDVRGTSRRLPAGIESTIYFIAPGGDERGETRSSHSDLDSGWSSRTIGRRPRSAMTASAGRWSGPGPGWSGCATGSPPSAGPWRSSSTSTG